MENKYYTPTIEEFHVGFEYEVLNDTTKEFVSTICDKKMMFLGGYGSWNLATITTPGNNHLIRVKYLDQSDIESLGWVYSGTSIDKWYNLIKDCQRPLSNFMNRSFRLQHDFRTNQGIVIDAYEYDNFSGAEEILYRGSCKNKSELIKLMQQLNIK